MAAPKGPYSPKTGPLAGQQFDTYFQYQQARARELGYKGYKHERQVRATPLARGLFESERVGIFGRVREGPTLARRPTLPRERRTFLSRLLAEFSGQDLTDRRRGGALDRYLQRLGRRRGDENWNPGETPDR